MTLAPTVVSTDRGQLVEGEPARAAAPALRRVVAFRGTDPVQGKSSLPVGRVLENGFRFESRLERDFENHHRRYRQRSESFMQRKKS